MMKRTVLGFTVGLLWTAQAVAQCSGIFSAGEFCGNSTASGALAGRASPTAMFDRGFGSTRGSIVSRGAATWGAIVPGTSGYLFGSNGVGSDPTYQGFIQAGTGATTRTWQDKVRDTFSVKDFMAAGAVPGSQNDQPAFLAAYNAAVAAGGGQIEITPSSTCYRFDSTWNVATTTVAINIRGYGACVSTGTALAEIIRIGPADGSTSRISLASLRGLTIRGNTVGGTTAALRIRNAIYSTFTDIRIEGAIGDGIRADGNAGVADPLTQANLFQNIYIIGSGGRGGYFRGVKSSVFNNIQFDASTGYGAYWDLENQSGGANETTENVISNVVAKNGSSAGLVFSGIAKFAVSNLQVYINTGPGILFRGTISGTGAAFGPSSFNNITLRNNGTAGIDTVAGAGVNNLNLSNVSIVGNAGSAANGINMKAWASSNVSNVNVSGTEGSGLVTSDDASPPPGGSGGVAGVKISNFSCSGAAVPATASNGIEIGGSPTDMTINGVVSNRCGGATGYEINPTSATSAISIGNISISVNVAGHHILNPGRLMFFGVNSTASFTYPTQWLEPIAAPTTVTGITQFYLDSTSNLLTLKDGAGVVRSLQTTATTDILPVAKGGVDPASWTAYTPAAPTCTAGGPPTTSFLGGRWKKIAGDPKSVALYIAYTISALNGCTGDVSVALPVGITPTNTNAPGNAMNVSTNAALVVKISSVPNIQFIGGSTAQAYSAQLLFEIN